MITVHGDIYSGNCYKVKLALSLLDIAHEWVPINILQGESRTSAYLRINPNGRIPAVVLDDGRTLAESNAILYYFADGTTLLPESRYDRAQVLQWQNFEQYSHEPFIATSRYIIRYLGSPPERRGELEAKRSGGEAALRIMESHLESRQYFVADRYSIADIALYAYTHVAHEGGFPLDDYPAIRAWCARISAHPKHVLMQ